MTTTRRARTTIITIAATAAALAAGLLLGGSTAALWNTGDPAGFGVVFTGDLAIEETGEPEWYDLSTDVAGTPVPIDGERFLTVPGDVIAVDQPFEVELAGDHAAARLDIAVPVPTNRDGGTLVSDVSVAYTLYDADGAPVPGVEDVAAGTGSTIAVPANTGTAEYRLRVVFSWRDGTPDRVRVTDVAEIDAVAVELRQVRP